MVDTRNQAIHIRLACSEDSTAVALVLRESFAEYEHFYTKAAYDVTTPEPSAVRDRMKEGPMWVAAEDGQVVGTASALLTENGLHVRGMGVRPSARGREIGRLLLEHIEAFAVGLHIQRLFLSTTPFLERAMGLYERSGFRRIDGGAHRSVRDSAFYDGETLMRGDLTGNPNTASYGAGKTCPD